MNEDYNIEESVQSKNSYGFDKSPSFTKFPDKASQQTKMNSFIVAPKEHDTCIYKYIDKVFFQKVFKKLKFKYNALIDCFFSILN